MPVASLICRKLIPSVCLPQHLAHLAHRQSLRWHREPRSVAGSLITRFDRRQERRSGRHHRLSAIIGMLSGLRRNPVRNASDSAPLYYQAGIIRFFVPKPSWQHPFDWRARPAWNLRRCIRKGRSAGGTQIVAVHLYAASTFSYARLYRLARVLRRKPVGLAPDPSTGTVACINGAIGVL